MNFKRHEQCILLFIVENKSEYLGFFVPCNMRKAYIFNPPAVIARLSIFSNLTDKTTAPSQISYSAYMCQRWNSLVLLTWPSWPPFEILLLKCQRYPRRIQIVIKARGLDSYPRGYLHLSRDYMFKIRVHRYLCFQFGTNDLAIKTFFLKSNLYIRGCLHLCWAIYKCTRLSQEENEH